MVVPVVLAFSLFTSLSLAQQQNQSTPEARDKNLILALTQLAGMYACDRMRGKFRTIKSEGRDKRESASGTLWIRECSASSEGDRLSLSLGGQGWRWIYRQKERVGAEFEVSQYGTFKVDVAVTGNMDAHYDPQAQQVSVWFRPVSEPEVSFTPLGQVDVETEGFWSSVVGGMASLVMQSPESQAYQQFQSMGRKRFGERFSQGYTAQLDFCTGRLRTGFGLDGKNQSQGQDPGGTVSSATEAFMHPDGLIIDGPFDIDPNKFQVTVQTDRPVQAQLVCAQQAEKLAEAFLEKQRFPEISTLTGTRVEKEESLHVEEQIVHCPVALVLSAVEDPPQVAFPFSYTVTTAPLMKTAAQKCENQSRSQN